MNSFLVSNLRHGQAKEKVVFGKALEILIPPYISQLGAGPDAIYLDS